MSKKKNKSASSSRKNNNDEKYLAVMSALAYLFERQNEEEKRELTKAKIKRVIGWLTIIGSTVLIALSLISDYSFDITWASNAKKWYGDIYVSFMAYVVITDIVLILEKRFKFDQKPLFGYIWPFIGFFITLFLTNTMNVDFIPGEPRLKISLFIIFLLPASLMMSSSYKTGKEIANQKNGALSKAKQIINDNPDVVKDIVDDYDKYLRESGSSDDKK